MYNLFKIQIGLEIIEVRDPIILLKSIEKNIQKACYSTEAIAYYVSKENLYRVNNDNTSLDKFPLTGLISEAVKSNKVEEYSSGSQSAKFNLLVDIDKPNSLRCIPIYHKKLESVVIVIEYVNKMSNIIMNKKLLKRYAGFVCYAYDEINKIDSMSKTLI